MYQQLHQVLSQTGKRILFVGIGNVLKKDDGAGVYISSGIIPRKNLYALTVEVSIENYIGKINALHPDILILIDCVDMGEKPGTVRLLAINEINDHTFNTHNISLRKLAGFFKAETWVLGIQPEDLGFGENISYLVKGVSNTIINLINKAEVSHGS